MGTTLRHVGGKQDARQVVLGIGLRLKPGTQPVVGADVGSPMCRKRIGEVALDAGEFP